MIGTASVKGLIRFIQIPLFHLILSYISIGKVKHLSISLQALSKKEAEERLNEGVEKLELVFQQQGRAVDDLLCIAKVPCYDSFAFLFQWFDPFDLIIRSVCMKRATHFAGFEGYASC